MNSIVWFLNKLPVRGLYFFLAAIFAGYIGAMAIYPFTQGDWEHVQNVWDRWQGWNVGVFAFLSSLLAFNISRSGAEKQRHREFVAARAFLPDSLSELHEYLEECTAILNRAFNKKLDSAENKLPSMPLNFRDVFKECIKHGDPETTEYLAKILNKLQVHRARFSDVDTFQISGPHMNRHDYYFRYYDTGELLAMLGRVFPFARAEEGLDTSKLQYGEFITAYRSSKVDSGIEEDLFKFTKDRLKNKPY